MFQENPVGVLDPTEISAGWELKDFSGFHYIYCSKPISHGTYCCYQKEQIAPHQLSMATLCVNTCWHILWVSLPTAVAVQAQYPDGKDGWEEAEDWSCSSYKNTQCLHVFLCSSRILCCKTPLPFC